MQCSNLGIHCDINSYISSDNSNISLKTDKSQMSHSLLWAMSNYVKDLFSLERIYIFKKYIYLESVMLLTSTVGTTSSG